MGRGEIRPSVLLLAGTSLIPLVITRATVASALLVRLAERQRELRRDAPRSALRDSGWRGSRQRGALALAVGHGGRPAPGHAILPLFRALVPAVVPRAGEIAVNFWLVLFAAAVACLVTTLSALVPALQASSDRYCVDTNRGRARPLPIRGLGDYGVPWSSRRPR